MLGMKLGLSPALAIFQGANEVWRWTPAQLFAGGVAGFWAAGFNPNGQRLWQDAVASARALVAGDPVGKVERAFGTVDPAQATALSRPALGRWPKGAKARNLMRSTQDLTNSFWSKSHCTLTAAGLVTCTGNAGANGYPVFHPNMANRANIPAKAGDQFTVSITAWIDPDNATLAAKHVTIEIPANVTVNASSGSTRSAVLNLETGTIAHSASNVSAVSEDLGGGKRRLHATFTMPEGCANYFYANFFAGAYSSQPAGTTLYMEDPQVVLGPTDTPHQPTDADGVPLAGYGQVRNMLATNTYEGTAWSVNNSLTGASGVLGTVPSVVNGIPVMVWRLDNSAGTAASRAVGRSVNTVLPLWVYSIYAKSSQNVKIRTGYGDFASKPVSPNEWTRIHVLKSNRIVGTEGVFDPIWVEAQAGQIIEFALPQFEPGTTVSPVQIVRNQNDITEAGVPDVPFLVNDGNDGLPAASLPAGTYGIAWANPAAGVIYATQTLSSSGSIDVLRGTRMCDVIVRQGDFSTAEKAQIEAYWAGIAA